MDPVTLVLVPGIVGGLAIALAVVLVNRRSRPSPPVVMPFRPDRPTTDMINMASIKVAGIGGLGLVAMAVAVSLGVPQIGGSMAIGLGLGVLVAVLMIVRARRKGPMPSSGEGMGANTMLALDDTNGRRAPRSDERSSPDALFAPAR